MTEIVSYSRADEKEVTAFVLLKRLPSSLTRAEKAIAIAPSDSRLILTLLMLLSIVPAMYALQHLS